VHKTANVLNKMPKALQAKMFKLAQSASRRWRRLNGHHQLVLVLEGRIFRPGRLFCPAEPGSAAM
jgi:hypothetical protein